MSWVDGGGVRVGGCLWGVVREGTSTTKEDGEGLCEVWWGSGCLLEGGQGSDARTLTHPPGQTPGEVLLYLEKADEAQIKPECRHTKQYHSGHVANQQKANMEVSIILPTANFCFDGKIKVNFWFDDNTTSC